MTVFTDVNSYIESTPKEYHARLLELRDLIKETVPNAEESISYHMPSYAYKGTLVFFCLWKKHIGLYGLAESVLNQFMTELGDKVTHKGTVNLPLNEALPRELITKLLHAQVKKNEGQ